MHTHIRPPDTRRELRKRNRNRIVRSSDNEENDNKTRRRRDVWSIWLRERSKGRKRGRMIWAMAEVVSFPHAWCRLKIEWRIVSFRPKWVRTCYSSRSIVIEMIVGIKKTKTKMSASICFRVAICRAFCRDCFRRFTHLFLYFSHPPPPPPPPLPHPFLSQSSLSLSLPLPVSDIKNQDNSTILNIILHTVEFS